MKVIEKHFHEGWTRNGLYNTGGFGQRRPRAALKGDDIALQGLPPSGGWARGAWETRIALAGLLVVLVLAKLAGMQSLLGASDWVRDQECFLREGLQLSWKRMPCANTYSYALARLDRKPREYSPGGLVRAQRGRKSVRTGTESSSGTPK
jgi:hypothetical protein